MKRKEFIGAAALAGMAPLSAVAAAAKEGREYYELRQYHMISRGKTQPLNDFLQNAAIPAWNRQGIKTVGAFKALYGPSSPSLYVLLPHPSLESVATVGRKLMADKEFLAAGADFVNRPLSDPGYARVESTLLAAFDEMPKLELSRETTARDSRIFELRIYESHSIKAARKKIEMFNKGGEIAIFRKTGLQPLMFGETLIGPRMPNLHYMLAFDDMEARDAAWAVFGSDPDWQALRQVEEYKDTVSNISDVILRPTSYSQI